MCYHLNFRIPTMPRQFSRRISQNPDYERSFCKDRKNPLHF